MRRRTVELTPRALRELDAMPEPLQLRIALKIKRLSDDPLPRGSLVKRLQGFEMPVFRLRIGDYRAVFVVEENRIVVLRIIHRRELERALAALKH